MHKQDTARLNGEALGDLIRAGELKQWWVARQIGVDSKTVNRWLTGKVKRISRDNLARLCNLIGCAEEAITFADEGDLRATRSEQGEASRALLEPHTKNLFERHEDYAIYESLLKATMHPDMTVSQLSEVYKQLMILAARQNKLDDARRYAETALDYAARCGNTRNELAARNNLIVLDAQTAPLHKTIARLETHASFCESVGELNALGATQINIAHAFRLLAEFNRAIRAINRAFSSIDQGIEKLGGESCEVNASSIARDVGWFELAAALLAASLRRDEVKNNERVHGELKLYHAEIISLQGHTAEAAEAALPLLELLPRFASFTQTYYISSAGILRRAGLFGRALEQTEAGLAASFTRDFEQPFLYEEQARIRAAQGDWGSAHSLRRRANSMFSDLGMPKRVQEDPALEVGQGVAAPRVRIRHWPLG